MPKNYSVPEDLKIFLKSIKSELQDPRNRNRETCNLPLDELNALKDIIQLQKERQIVVRACDKGAGIMILNFNDYLRACYEHLASETVDGKPYYTQVNELELERTKTKITRVLEDALKDKIISQSEFNAMSVEEKGPGRFYCNFKVHKKHEHMKPPPISTVAYPPVAVAGPLASKAQTDRENRRIL